MAFVWIMDHELPFIRSFRLSIGVDLPAEPLRGPEGHSDVKCLQAVACCMLLERSCGAIEFAVLFGVDVLTSPVYGNRPSSSGAVSSSLLLCPC